MPTEVQEAAGRLRPFQAEMKTAGIHERMRLIDEYPGGDEQLYRDEQAVIDDSLAANPADDGEPADVEWFIAEFRASVDSISASVILPTTASGYAVELRCFPEDDHCNFSLLQWSGGEKTDHIALTCLPDRPTRGAVRRLVAALQAGG